MGGERPQRASLCTWHGRRSSRSRAFCCCSPSSMCSTSFLLSTLEHLSTVKATSTCGSSFSSASAGSSLLEPMPARLLALAPLDHRLGGTPSLDSSMRGPLLYLVGCSGVITAGSRQTCSRVCLVEQSEQDKMQRPSARGVASLTAMVRRSAGSTSAAAPSMRSAVLRELKPSKEAGTGRATAQCEAARPERPAWLSPDGVRFTHSKPFEPTHDSSLPVPPDEEDGQEGGDGMPNKRLECCAKASASSADSNHHMHSPATRSSKAKDSMEFPLLSSPLDRRPTHDGTTSDEQGRKKDCTPAPPSLVSQATPAGILTCLQSHE
mmetsp:Transcript_92528/g.267149  ORF Transcript_92528/g.267149 Transcript_92528/m.267149 type:complete len:322 (-) Transcript_92528:334-1299(-)